MKDPVLHQLTRRKMLAFLGGASAAAFFGWGRTARTSRDSNGAASVPSAANAATPPSCVVRPGQTEGPYFIDQKLNRSDIRVEPSDNTIKPGVPLRLAFRVSQVSGSSCTPINGAVVDIWQCDALGAYSDVRDINAGFNTRGKQFLRGYQVTNANGIAEFVTIYPGWYGGRTVHIHFKIRADLGAARRHEFTSQVYFDESITDEVHKQFPYNSRGRRTTTNDSDFIFRRGGKQLLLKLTTDKQGFAARFDIGLEVA
jgi:protocatechuate 3,4-dioxygenase beta subunit